VAIYAVFLFITAATDSPGHSSPAEIGGGAILFLLFVATTVRRFIDADTRHNAYRVRTASRSARRNGASVKVATGRQSAAGHARSVRIGVDFCGFRRRPARHERPSGELGAGRI
jgi:hypothetical protein